MTTLQKLSEMLNVLKVIKPEGSSSINGMIKIDKSEKKEKYCILLCDLAIELQKYFQYFEKIIEDKQVNINEVEKLCEFINELTLYFKEIHFLNGRKSQAWVDMTYLLFGTIIYHRAQLRLIDKTIELFFLQENLAELEEVVYNKCYYELIGYKN